MRILGSHLVATIKEKMIICDVCKKSFDHEKDVFELQEFVHVDETAGYGSIFRDGTKIQLDICQYCLKEKLGEFLVLTGGFNDY